MSLQQFLRDNRRELIQGARARAVTRGLPQVNAAGTEHEIPLLLAQLATALRQQQQQRDCANITLASPTLEVDVLSIRRQFRQFGFGIEQVVQGYVDVCELIVEIDERTGALVTSEEFCALDRCLDHAIAAAIDSRYGERD